MANNSAQPSDRIYALSIDDYDRLLALWQRVELHSLRPDGRDSREAVGQQLKSGVQTILGLEVEGRLVGAVIATHDSRKGWINRLVVDPAFRRRGYGKRLVLAAEETLQAQGMQVIAALIEGENSTSLSLFLDAGYVEIDTQIHYLSKRESDRA
jgi:ribosomal protein S18 acetylase RimI-like enzyme